MLHFIHANSMPFVKDTYYNKPCNATISKHSCCNLMSQALLNLHGINWYKDKRQISLGYLHQIPYNDIWTIDLSKTHNILKWWFAITQYIRNCECINVCTTMKPRSQLFLMIQDVTLALRCNTSNILEWSVVFPNKTPNFPEISLLRLHYDQRVWWCCIGLLRPFDLIEWVISIHPTQ